MNDVASAPAEGGEASGDVSSGGGEASHWSESVFGEGAELASNTNRLSDYKSPEDLLQAHNNALQWAEGALRIPSAEAGDEAWDKFYSRLDGVPGVVRTEKYTPPPESADAYQFTNPDGYQADPENDGGFAKLAHELGLSNEQADRLRMTGIEKGMQNEQAREAALDEAYASLEKEWGPAMDRNTERAIAAVDMMEPYNPGLKDFLIDQGIDTHPAMVKFFHNLAVRMGEVPASEAGQPGGIMTPAEASAKIEEIRGNPNHPRNVPDHPMHEAARKEYDELYLIRMGKSGRV